MEKNRDNFSYSHIIFRRAPPRRDHGGGQRGIFVAL
jgi:hypothetical protein